MSLTPSAVAKFREFLGGPPGDHIRLSVKRDGPMGFMYDLQIESPPHSDDDLLDRTIGFLLVVSPHDALYLDGAQIDWQNKSDGTAGFKFNNPNAVDDDDG
ncbi:MAG: iron-sulfur cluster assembly accessory protein [Planctomycetota bacterium]